MKSSPFSLIKDLFLEYNIFIRNKKPLEAKVLAFFDSLEGMTLSGVVRKPEYVHGLKVCKASIAYWLKKIREKVEFAEPRSEHELIAIDETCLKLNGKRIWIFAGIDAKTREIVAIHTSTNIGFLDVSLFVIKLLRACSNKPHILVDKGSWYPPVLKRYWLTYAQVGRGFRNYIERWFRTMKERTKRFYNNFPYHNVKKGIFHIQKFLEIFVFWYNRLRIHESLGCAPSSLKGGALI